MNIRIDQGLPLVTCKIFYQKSTVLLNDVLIDTGSAATVFDSDSVASIGLLPNSDARIVKMYGIGGKSDYCFELMTEGLMIDRFLLHHFTIQLGNLRDAYGFHAILGVDFLLATGLLMDLNQLALVDTKATSSVM